MNKTYPINISGIVFYINDDAFIILESYLKSIEAHYLKTEDGREIISDIESRIAELLSEKVNKHKQAINIHEIEDVIKKLGRVEDFEDNESGNGDYNNYSKAGTFSHPKTTKKFYRDAEDGIIAGVCSGISNYIGIDVILVRIIFILLIIGGAIGFWIYVILWSISAYARTTTEKLEMKGEAIILSNIERNIKDEFENVRASFRQQNIAKRIKGIIKTIINLTGTVIRTVLKLLKSIFGFSFIIIGVIFLSLIASYFLFDSNIIFVNDNEWFSLPIKNILLLVANEKQSDIFIISLLGIIIIPFISIIYVGLRLILGLKSKNKAFGLISFILLIFSSIIFSLGVIDIVKEFKSRRTSSYTIDIKSESNNLFVMNADNSLEFSNSEYIFPGDEYVLRKNSILVRRSIMIRESADSLFHIRVKKIANGKNKRVAQQNADEIEYIIEQKGDSVFINQYSIHPKMYRGQRIEIDIYKPKGKEINFNSDIELLY